MLDPNIAVDDHAYFTLTNENTTIAKNCLDEETLNTTNELCDYINTDHAYIQSDCKNTSIADYSLDNELGTSDDIEYDPVEEQCIDIECTTTVHVHVDPFTELKKKCSSFSICHMCAIQIVKISKSWKLLKTLAYMYLPCLSFVHVQVYPDKNMKYKLSAALV